MVSPCEVLVFFLGIEEKKEKNTSSLSSLYVH